MEIQIRHVEPEDVPAIHAMLISGHTVAGTMRLPYAPLSSTRQRLEPREDTITITAEFQGAVAGFAELVTNSHHRHNHVGEINMVVADEAHQGLGVGRALLQALVDLADDWLHLVRLQLYVWNDNVRAIALYEDFGFDVEGTLPRFVRGRGQYLDALVMGRVSGQTA